MAHNALSEAQAERLALLLEELGEAQQCIGKILRHGYDKSRKPKGRTNRENLEREMGDITIALHLMIKGGDLSAEKMTTRSLKKLRYVMKYLYHQRGPVKPPENEPHG